MVGRDRVRGRAVRVYLLTAVANRCLAAACRSAIEVTPGSLSLPNN